MRTHRWFRPLMALALSLALLVAAVPAAAAFPAPPSAVTLPDAGQYPMTVTDFEGRAVTIPSVPQRIISVAPSNTEIVYALGAQDRLVGVDTYSDYPAAARDVARIGDLFNPNFEAMVAAQPDLVLAIGGSGKMWEKLAAAGVPVVVLQPANLRQVMESIQLLGRILDLNDQAAAVVADMQDQLEAVQFKLGFTSYRPRVFWEIWHEPLMSAGPGSFMDDLITLSGGTNVAGNADSAWPEMSLEAVIAADPEVIITSQRDWADKLLSGELEAWANTTAVKRGNVIVVDDDLTSRPGPRMIYGLEQVASALHPLLFWIWMGY